MRRVSLFLCLTVGLLSCATPSAQVQVPEGPPAWQEAFVEGFHSALATLVPPAQWPYQVAYSKDLARVDTDAAYRDGWETGFTVGKTRIEAWQRDTQHRQQLLWGAVWR